MATLSDILKNSIAGKQPISDVEQKLNPLGAIPVPQQQPFRFRPASDYITPQPFQPAKPSLGEYALDAQAPAQPTLPSGAQPPAGLSQFSPAEQTAIKNDAAKSGLTSYNVEFRQPSVGGVRAPRAEAPVVAAPTVETAPTSGLEAYMTRTGITETPRAPIEVLDATGRVNTSTPEAQQAFDTKTAAFQAYLNSPEGQADQARQAALPNQNLVEVVRGDKTTFENVGAGGVNPALRDYLFGQQQTEQQQRDYLSAVQKPVGAPLTQGEAEALKVGERAIQVEGAKDVANIGAGAQIGSARISAEGGKNPLYEAAVQDINATTDPVLKASKLQQYLGGRTATPTSDPDLKTFAAQLYTPEEQATFAALIANKTPAARAFALTKQKYGLKE